MRARGEGGGGLMVNWLWGLKGTLVCDNMKELNRAAGINPKTSRTLWKQIQPHKNI